MLEPLTALSLAAAILQFADFGITLAKGGYESYKSSHGAVQEDVETQDLARNLEELCTKLSTTNPLAIKKFTTDELALQGVAKRCLETAADLSLLIESLKVTSKGTKRIVGIIQKQVKRVTVRVKTDALQKQLESMKSQMSVHLLSIIRNQQSSTSYDIAEVDAKIQSLGAATSQNLQALKFGLQQAITSGNDNLQKSLEDLIAGITTARTEYSILHSLTFEQMPIRKTEIRDAHSETFEWIFDAQKSPFRTWLTSEEGIFWISGKPGSGKSTLMKFLDNHKETRRLLQLWAVSNKETVVTASFYFWLAGHRLQKSQEGLLQGLVFQVLCQCPHLISEVFPGRWSADDIFRRYTRPWTRSELSNALRTIVESPRLNVKFAFLIDGLDEYEGDHRQLALDIQALAKSKWVKLCLSSRPWTEFIEIFGKDDVRHLFLQDFTRNDIERYVRSELAKNDLFMQLAQSNPQAEELTKVIRDRADGVFLWVFLVVRSLLRGLAKKDDIAMLRSRLDDLPSDLEDYFDRMLESIDMPYRGRAARILQMTIKDTFPISAIWYIPEEMTAPNFVFSDTMMDALDDNQQLERVQRAIRDVNAWCRDLLEIWYVERPHLAESLYPFRRPTVQFIHRTVRDFLMTRRAQAWFYKCTSNTKQEKFDPFLSLLRSHLYEAKHILSHQLQGESSFHFTRAARDMFAVARAIEEEATSEPETYEQFLQDVGPSIVQLLNELDKVRSHRFSPPVDIEDPSIPAWTNAWSCEFLFLYRVTQFSISVYVRHALETNEALRRSENKWQLWDAALHNDPQKDVVQLLIDHKIDINHCSGWGSRGLDSPWKRFVSRLHPKVAANTRDILVMLIRYGADLDAPNVHEDLSARENIWRCNQNSRHAELETLLLEAPKKPRPGPQAKQQRPGWLIWRPWQVRYRIVESKEQKESLLHLHKLGEATQEDSGSYVAI